MENTIIQRVKEIILYKNISARAFANTIHFNYSTLNNYLTGRRTNIDFNLISSITSSYDDISTEWLLRGEGEMIKSSSVAKVETRPRIPYDAAAGTLTESIDGVVEYQCEQIPIISAFPKYDFTITIKGNSMEPEFHSGDEVACLRINEKQFIQWGQVHVLDTDQGVVIKRIYDAGEKVRCHSYNHEEYPDFEIAKNNIRLFALVVGQLRLK